MSRRSKDQSPPTPAIPNNASSLTSVSLPIASDLLIPSEYKDVSSPLDRYLDNHRSSGRTILSRFDDSLMDVADNTRKAYNTDVWIALAIKLFRDWEFPLRYNELAAEIVRLEALRLLGSAKSTDPSEAQAVYTPIYEALRALADKSIRPSDTISTPFDPPHTHVCGTQVLRMSLRGSSFDSPSDSHLSKVCINSTDKKIIHYLFSRYDSLFDVDFWNLFFRSDSLGRIFREQEQQNCPATLARKMASLYRFEVFLYGSKLLTEPSLCRNTRPRVKRTAQTKLTGDELKQISEYLDRHVELPSHINSERTPALILRDRAMYSILRQYLLRANALCGLSLDDIDLNRKVKTMRVVEKGRKEVVLPLEGDALRCLNEYLGVRQQFLQSYPPISGHENFVFHTVFGRQMTPRCLSRILNQRAHEAGIKVQVGAHVIRRSGGTHYIESGVRVEALAQLMNHENIATTWRYVGDAKINLSHEVFKKL